jgi:diguanylate cyclase (GGDEF)-like protein
VLEVFHRTPVEPEPEWFDYLDAIAGQAAIAVDNASLFDDLQRSHTELAMAYDATIEGWAAALDLRDKETQGHTRRVAEMSLRLANLLGIGGADLAHLRRGALLHDVGKLGIPDSILLKPGELSEEEWQVMRRHPGYAHEWLSSIPFLRPALDIPYCHHEKWDGTGYPRGLKGEQIPLAARIFAAVDIWDALRFDRPYRAALPEEQVIVHLRALSGTHLDPRVVEVFLRVLSEGDDPDDGVGNGRGVYPLGCESMAQRLRQASERNRELESQREELLQVITRLTESSMTDDLTGLMSRQHFTEAMSRAFSFAARHDEPLSLIVLEVDRFEVYNDLHGDRAGDAILQALARVLREQVRAYDVVAHYGRGKFAVLLPSTEAHGLRIIAVRLRAAIAGHAWPLGPVTASVGGAIWSSAMAEPSQLVEEADRALDHAKRSGPTAPHFCRATRRRSSSTHH